MTRWTNNNKSQNASSKKSRWSGSSGEDGDENSKDRAYQLFAQMMIEKIKSFKGQWEQPWFNVGISMPRAIYGKKYNGMNALMLMLHCEKNGYKIPVFATRKHIFSMNFKDNDHKVGEYLLDENGNKREFVHILKDSKSFPVFVSNFSIYNKKTRESISYQDYRLLSPEDQKDYKFRHYSNVYNVFNVEQTNIKDARPEIWEKLVNEYSKPLNTDNAQEQLHIPEMDHMIDNNLWYCPIKFEEQNRAYFSPRGFYIMFPTREQFMAKGDKGESFYGNLFHEIGHSTGHHTLLNRVGASGLDPDPNLDRKKVYGTEELIVELTSAILMRDRGFSSYLEKDSVPYLQNWLDSLKEDPEYITNVLNDVKSAAYKINSRLDEVRKIMLGNDIDESCDDDREEFVGFDMDGNGVIEGDEIDRKHDNDEYRHHSAIRM